MNIPLERVGVLSDGVYKIRITETEDRTSAAGNAYVNLTCTVLDDMGKDSGVTIWHTLTMTPKSRFMIGQFLDAIGAPATGSINSRSFKGKTFWAQVGKDTYQGKTKNIISACLTPEQAKKEPDTIHNVFNLNGMEDESPSNGYDDSDLTSWDEDDDDSTATLPEEMDEEAEDTKF
jgi:hypothetical protein